MVEITSRTLKVSAVGPRAVMFDMDVTLVSSFSGFVHCVNEISTRYLGRQLSADEVVSRFGPAASVVVRNLTARLSEEAQAQAVSDFYQCWASNASSKLFVFPGITELLRRIQSSGKRLALITGIERVMMEATLRPFELSRFFGALISLDDVKQGKPDPEGILLALRRLNVLPHAAIYIGDSPVDIVAGKRAGVMTGAALWKDYQTKDPTKEHPDYVFRSVDQLSEFLFPGAKGLL